MESKSSAQGDAAGDSKSTSSKLKREYKTLETLKFDNLALVGLQSGTELAPRDCSPSLFCAQRALPVDAEKRNFLRQVANACFSRVMPTPLEKPELIVTSQPALDLIDIPASETERKDFAELFAGNTLIEGTQPSAHCCTLRCSDELFLKLLALQTAVTSSARSPGSSATARLCTWER